MTWFAGPAAAGAGTEILSVGALTVKLDGRVADGTTGFALTSCNVECQRPVKVLLNSDAVVAAGFLASLKEHSSAPGNCLCTILHD